MLDRLARFQSSTDLAPLPQGRTGLLVTRPFRGVALFPENKKRLRNRQQPAFRVTSTASYLRDTRLPVVLRGCYGHKHANLALSSTASEFRPKHTTRAHFKEPAVR